MNVNVMRELRIASEDNKSGDVGQVIIIRVTPHGKKSVQYVVNSADDAVSMLEYAEGGLL